MSEMTELSPTQCQEYLERGGVGRLAFLTPGGLRIVPLNFCTNADAIVFRTVADSELGTYGEGAEAVFEIDEIDHEAETGWSCGGLRPGRATFGGRRGVGHPRLAQPHALERRPPQLPPEAAVDPTHRASSGRYLPVIVERRATQGLSASARTSLTARSVRGECSVPLRRVLDR